MFKKVLSGWLTLLLLVSGAYLAYAEKSLARASVLPGSDSDPEPLEFSVVAHPDGTWEGEAHFPPPSPPASPGLETALDAQIWQEAAAIFRGYGVRHSLSGDGVFSLAGGDVGEIVELALGAGRAVERFEGPVALDLRGSVRRGQPLTLTLTANPATGYSWEMATAPGGAIFQVGDVETHMVAPGFGVPGRQVVRLRAAETGPARLRLIYRRPWQADLAPTAVISVQADGLDLAAACSVISVPQPTSPPSYAFGSLMEEPGSSFSTQSLPDAYNWCDGHGGCTPVKDQGSCGSCWAFGTVGPLEAHLRAAGELTDLSEQYLVSCNTSDWDCGGGWWAHDYHWNVKPSGEPQAGAVLESAFPYVARDDPCAGPYSHPYRIVSWHFVGGEYNVPSVDAIKQAIYDHGPVAAAVCVNSDFQRYSGGIFDPDTSCSAINHAIVLVGWDDSAQVWILRNSWGTGWGESGYMRIRYGVYHVGYSANYITYDVPLSVSDWVYLPVVARGTSAVVALANADFESGRDGSWSEFSTHGWDLVLNSSDLPVYAHGGSWAAWLGGGYDETAVLSQRITIPANSATLNYWYWGTSDDLCGYDYAYVQFDSTTLETYTLCESNNTGGWTSQQLDVSSWQGQTVELRFVVETDGSLNSNFFLDDVSLSTSSSSDLFSFDLPGGSTGHPTATRMSQ